MNHLSEITSKDNSKLKFVRSIRDGRESEYVFIEGVRLVEELFRSNIRIHLVCFSKTFLATHRDSPNFRKLQTYADAEFLEISDKLFDSISDTKNGQGIIVIAAKPKTGQQLFENLSPNPLLILLHKLNNPSNLGAILRAAEASGVNGVITTKTATDVFSAKAIRGGMGANFRLPIWTNADFSEVIDWAKAKNIQTIGADIRSQKSYLEIDWRVGKLLIMGSEGHGLTIEERALCGENMIVPMENGVESLNVAVAVGILLFEAKRQRQSN